MTAIGGINYPANLVTQRSKVLYTVGNTEKRQVALGAITHTKMEEYKTLNGRKWH